MKSGRLVQPPRSELTNFPYRELWLSLIPIHTYPSTTSPRTRVRRLNRRLTQDTSWEVQAQMVVASCAMLEAFPGDPDLLGEEKTTLLSIISVSTSIFVAWRCDLYPAPYGTLCLGVFFLQGSSFTRLCLSPRASPANRQRKTRAAGKIRLSLFYSRPRTRFRGRGLSHLLYALSPMNAKNHERR